MKHVKINAFDCPDAWYKTLSEIWQKGEIFKVGYGSEATETKKLKLHLTCYFRSWDAYAGLPANIAGIQLLNEAIVKEINELGNDRYSNWENISTGKLIFHSKNCHIYERQYKLIEELFKANSKTHMQRIKNL